MRKPIRRLRLREGDIVVVRNGYDLKNLMSATRGMKNLPNCPVVVAQESIHRLSKDYLRKLLAPASTESKKATGAGSAADSR